MENEENTTEQTLQEKIDNAKPGELVEVPADMRMADLPTQVMPQTQASTVDHLIELAITGDAGIEKLEKLLEMKERYDKREEEKRLAMKAEAAKDAYAADIVKFKAEGVEIYKDATVDFSSSKGRTYYMHASIGNVCAQIVTALAKHGFSHNWIPTQHDDGSITIKCIITHRLGHSESVEMRSMPDNSGNKNSIQAVDSAKTYMKRYTLLDITGLAPMDQYDDDGRAAGNVEPEIVTISEEQALKIDSMINDNDLDRAVLTKWLSKFFPYTQGDPDKLNVDHFKKVIAKIDESIKHKQEQAND